jgi:acyl carrier protein
MTDDELAELVKTTLIGVAPDIEGEDFDPNETFRDQFEIDSMDFLNFVIALHKVTGVDIPEADYPRLQTVSDTVAYLKAHGLAG